MATANPRAARERKQKIFVAVGGLLLVGILAIQLPKILGGSEPTATAETETTSTVPGETTPDPGTAAPATARTVALRDTDRRLAPGPGQFRSFSVFTRKDPFVQQIVSPDDAEESAGGSGGGGAETGGGEKTPESTPSEGFSVGETEVAAVTVISVNGARQALAPGVAFPAADPVFVLVAELPGSKTVVIGIAGGEYASGSRTTKLKVGKPLVLVNTSTGARYRLVLVAVGNGTATAAGTDRETPADGGSTTP